MEKFKKYPINSKEIYFDGFPFPNWNKSYRVPNYALDLNSYKNLNKLVMENIKGEDMAKFKILNVNPNIKYVSFRKCHHEIIDLIILPPNLHYLNIQRTNFNYDDMKKLPVNLKELSIIEPLGNSIVRLDWIPKTLEKLCVHNCEITHFDSLPSCLKELSVKTTNITNFDYLPSSLEVLKIDKCDIAQLENLPSNLKKIVRVKYQYYKFRLFTKFIGKIKNFI